MRLKMNTDILPLIEIGLYGTNLGDIYYNVDSEYNEDFKNAIVEYGKDKIEEILNNEDSIKKEIGHCEIENVSFRSPQWYNYENDSLDFDLIIDNVVPKQILFNVENIYKDMFFDWIERSYCSYSGFISFFPYKKEKYIEAIKGNDLERAVAMYIMFLIHIGKIDLEDYQYDFEDDIQEEVNKNGWQYMEEDDEY